MSSSNKSKVLLAKKYTDRILLNKAINNIRYKNVEYLWGSYSELYKIFSLKKANNYDFSKFSSFNSNKLYLNAVKYLPIYVIAIIYSLISYFYYLLTSIFKQYVAVWTGDFYNFELKSDFRLGNLYKELNHNKINFIEFIRLGEITYKSFFSNLYFRRRLAIYYDSFDIFFYFLTPISKIKIIDDFFTTSELKFVNNYLNNFSKNRYQIYLFKLLFKSFKIEQYIIWETSHRQLFSRIAASDCGVNTIGFMHGFAFNSYISYLHLDSYKGNFKFGPDIFIVWSQFWKKYFSKSSIYKTIYDWGPLRYNKFSDRVKEKSDEKLNVLFISEPLIDVSEMIGYLNFLISNKTKFNLTFKLRNLNCKFYKQLINNYPEYKSIDITTEPFEKAVEKFDLVIGSHSTAVVESSIFNVPFLAIITSKWGDYFEISKKHPNCVVNSLLDFDKKIGSIDKYNSKLLNQFSINFFGNENAIFNLIGLLK